MNYIDISFKNLFKSGIGIEKKYKSAIKHYFSIADKAFHSILVIEKCS